MVDQISVQCPDCRRVVHVHISKEENNADDALRVVHQSLQKLEWEHVYYGLFNILSKLVCEKCKHKYSSRTKIKV